MDGQADIDEGKEEGTTSDERAELVQLRRDNRMQAMEIEMLKRASAYFRPGECAPKMSYPVVDQLAADGILVTVTCRVLQVSNSSFYEWRSRPASNRDWEQAHPMNTIRDVHAASHGTYGHCRVHADLVLGQGLQVSHGRVERSMRATGLPGVHRRRLRGCTRRDQAAAPSADLVERNFTPAEPDRLYVADVTQHRTSEGYTSRWSSTASADASSAGRSAITFVPNWSSTRYRWRSGWPPAAGHDPSQRQ